MLKINKFKTIHSVRPFLKNIIFFILSMQLVNLPFLKYNVQATSHSPNFECRNLCPFKVSYLENQFLSKIINKLMPEEQTQLVCWLQILNAHVCILNNERDQIICMFKTSFSYKIEIKGLSDVQEGLITIKFVFPPPQNYQIVMQPLDLQTFNLFFKQLRVLQINQLHFNGNFKPIKIIGSGSSAKVIRSSSTIFSFEVAVRCLRRDNSSAVQIYEQASIMKSLSHPYICQLLEMYQTENSTYMIMKLQPRDLLSHLKKFHKINFSQCMILMKRITEAVVYIHENDIMHRDLKPQNILIRDKSNYNIRPIIADFGLASRQKFSQKVCGTTWYMAPQIYLKQAPYTKQCDIFSLGKIFFLLLFTNLAKQWIKTKKNEPTKTCIIDLEQNYFKNVPKQLKDLLFGMLQINPNLRLTAQEVLHHAFFTEPLPIPEDN